MRVVHVAVYAVTNGVPKPAAAHRPIVPVMKRNEVAHVTPVVRAVARAVIGPARYAAVIRRNALVMKARSIASAVRAVPAAALAASGTHESVPARPVPVSVIRKREKRNFPTKRTGFRTKRFPECSAN